MNLIKYRHLFFAISLAIIIPGIIALTTLGLKLGIDFVGGTIWELKFEQTIPQQEELKNFLNAQGAEVSQVVPTQESALQIRMKTSNETKINELKIQVEQSYNQIEILRQETVGPTISSELTQKAFLAIAVAIIAIVMYITWSFRSVPKPTSSFAFGICTIAALAHDVIVVVGAFALLGYFFAVEVDSLFITALLTVIGFSVHDTIVVFDRIRENLKKSDLEFEDIVNNSLLQTMSRSLNTSFTVIFVLLALFLFGGESIKTFVLALIIGIISGTYSSMFTAAPLLVTWQKLQARLRK